MEFSSCYVLHVNYATIVIIITCPFGKLGNWFKKKKKNIETAGIKFEEKTQRSYYERKISRVKSIFNVLLDIYSRKLIL